VDRNATDKEQVEMLKNWWNNTGKWIAIAIVIGLLAGSGWRFWKSHERVRAQAAAGLYQSILVAQDKHEFSTVNLLVNKMAKDYRATPYATMAKLVQAENAVKQKHDAVAIKALQWALTHTSQPSFKQIARLRLARVMTQQKQYQAALTLLNTVDDKTFMPIINQTQGDIYQAMGQSQKAQTAWQKAQSGYTSERLANPILNMQLASGSAK